MPHIDNNDIQEFHRYNNRLYILSSNRINELYEEGQRQFPLIQFGNNQNVPLRTYVIRNHHNRCGRICNPVALDFARTVYYTYIYQRFGIQATFYPYGQEVFLPFYNINPYGLYLHGNPEIIINEGHDPFNIHESELQTVDVTQDLAPYFPFS